MADNDELRAAPEAAVRAALRMYLDGAGDLAGFMEWLMDACGGRRAKSAPDIAVRIVAVVERHLAALRRELREVYLEAVRRGG